MIYDSDNDLADAEALKVGRTITIRTIKARLSAVACDIRTRRQLYPIQQALDLLDTVRARPTRQKRQP